MTWKHNWAIIILLGLIIQSYITALSIGAVEYTDNFCKGVRPNKECPGYDIKQSDGKAPVMLKLWRKWSTRSLSTLPGLLWPGVAATDRVLSMGQIELFDI